MLYGIEFKDSKKGLEEYPKEVREEIATTDKFDIYFSNPVTAIKVASFYEKSYDDHDYSVFELTAEQEKLADKSRIVDTFEQYQTMHAEHVSNAIAETLERNKINKIMANVKKHIDAMSTEELKEYGFKFEEKKEDNFDKTM